MVGIRFYLEFESQQAKKKATRNNGYDGHKGTVVAVFPELNWYGYASMSTIYDAIGALNDKPDSVVCSTSVSQVYLDQRCKRISEKLARKIHPKLFEYFELGG